MEMPPYALMFILPYGCIHDKFPLRKFEEQDINICAKGIVLCSSIFLAGQIPSACPSADIDTVVEASTSPIIQTGASEPDAKTCRLISLSLRLNSQTPTTMPRIC